MWRVGGSGYWRAPAGDEEPGAKPAHQPGDEHDTGPVDADRPAETDSSGKGWTYQPTGHWLNLDRLSDEALLQAQGYDLRDTAPQSRSGQAGAAKHADTRTSDEPDSPAQHEAGGSPITLADFDLADFDPRVHRSDRAVTREGQATSEQPEPEDADQLPQRDRMAPEATKAVERFEPRQANLPDVTPEQATDYIRDNADRRPWLKPAERSSADVQHVFAAVDQGEGHFVERHEGYASGERLQQRAERLEDPAQLDPELRSRGRDAEKPERLHGCEEVATSINDPDAFAAAVANGIQHPEVKAILDRPRQPHERLSGNQVEVPIEQLLGDNGHAYCAGYRLLPIDGDIEASVRNRKAWADATPEQRAGMTAPQVEPIPTDEFQGGTIVFGFCRTSDFQHWTIRTMYPKPRGLE
jgi:hypothetical protein